MDTYKILQIISQDLKHFLANPFEIHMVQALIALPQKKGLGPSYYILMDHSIV
jgi:hypothetical protein